MKLHSLVRQKNRKMPAKRIGRGYGTGKGGHTVGRGTKGQLSRTGKKIRAGFAGGQNPLYKSLPLYRGISSSTKKPIVVTLATIDKKYKTGEVVTVTSLQAKGVLKNKEGQAKILNQGEITKKLTIKGLSISKAAQDKIIKAGGSING